jgi:flagellar biosynthesis/type III secretory pathway chaperone
VTVRTRQEGRDTESVLVRLAEILDAEAHLYEEMARLSSHERGCLIQHDIDRLRRTVAQQEDLIARIDALEIERRETVAIVTERLGGPQTISLGEIVARAGDPERARLALLRDRILSEIARIQKINETNAYLIGSSLDLVEGELALLANDAAVEYDERGTPAETTPRTLVLDRRA